MFIYIRRLLVPSNLSLGTRGPSLRPTDRGTDIVGKLSRTLSPRSIRYGTEDWCF